MKPLSFWKKSLYSALIFFGTLIVLSVGYATWNATMSKVSSGNPLSATAWNALVDNIADLDSRWARSGGNIAFTGGNVGIGTTSPSGLLQISSGAPTFVFDANSQAVNVKRVRFGSSIFTAGDLALQAMNDDGSIKSTNVTFTNAGNVGIGTSSPASKLDINGALTIEPGCHPGWTNGANIDNCSGYTRIQSVNSGTVSNLAINQNGGNVGIGTFSPSYTLHVNGSVAGNSWTLLSDQRFKKNITPLRSALDAVGKLQGVTFDWRAGEFKDRNFPKGKQVGFIAQEVEKVIPEVVTTDQQWYKWVEYANITAVLVEAVKEQQKQIAALQTEVRELKNRK